MSVSATIILGVVSGILTSAVLWALATLFKKQIIPWYQVAIYQGVIITGRWKGYYTDCPDLGQASVIDLKQRGHVVTGQILMTKQPTGRECHKIFECRGIIKDNNLVLTYDARERSKLGSGSQVMTLVQDGNRLEGTSVYVSSDKNEVGTLGEYWERADSI